MENQLLYSIIDKLVNGRSDWTLEELQYQRNYPNEIEHALNEIHRRNNHGSNKFVALHSGCNLLQCGGKIVLTYPEAIMLALYVPTLTDSLQRVAVLAFDDDFLDMAVFELESGVFEVICTAFVPSVNSEAVYSSCHQAIKQLEGPVNRLLVVTNGHYDFTYEQLAGSIFGVDAELMANLKQLTKRGCEIREGISKGLVKDVLLLSVVTQAIGIEDADGKMLTIIEADTTIPCQRSRQIELDASTSEFCVKIWQGNSLVAKKNALIAIPTMINDCIRTGSKKLMEVTIDIDSNKRCQCNLIDINTGRKKEVIV